MRRLAVSQIACRLAGLCALVVLLDLCLLAGTTFGQQILRFEAEDITERFDRANGRLCTIVPAGRHLLGLFFLCPVPEWVTFRNGSYLDTMDDEACQEFVRCCYEPNIAAVQNYLGTTVKGIFTDEPGLMIHDGTFATRSYRPTVADPFRRLPGSVMAWSRRFPEMFEAWRGYDLRPHLLSLVYETCAEDLRVRQDYYQCATNLFAEAFYGQVQDWCRAHGTRASGHAMQVATTATCPRSPPACRWRWLRSTLVPS